MTSSTRSRNQLQHNHRKASRPSEARCRCVKIVFIFGVFRIIILCKEYNGVYIAITSRFGLLCFLLLISHIASLPTLEINQNYMLFNTKSSPLHPIHNSLYISNEGLQHAAFHLCDFFTFCQHWPVVDGYLCEPVFNMVCIINHGHYSDVIMNAMASQITGILIVNSTVCWGADQGKYQSSALLAFVRGIHLLPVNSPHKWPVTRKMFQFDDVIMRCGYQFQIRWSVEYVTGNAITIWKPISETVVVHFRI